MATRIKVEAIQAPAEPPPLLTEASVTELCWNGWIEFELPEELARNIDNLQAAALSLFSQNETEKLAAVGGRNFGEEGYYDVPGEKQYITYRRSINPKLYLELLLRSVWSDIANLLHRMLCDLSRAGGLPLEAWKPIIENALSLPATESDLTESTSLLRLFQYQPKMGAADKHSDLGLLTMCVGEGAGLEMLDRHGLSRSWKPAPKCVVLVGESLRALSSQHIRTGVHRVIANPMGRRSLVFALRPNLKATVKLKDFGGHGQLDMKEMFLNIRSSKYNVNEKRDIREKQKEKNAITANSAIVSTVKREVPNTASLIADLRATD